MNAKSAEDWVAAGLAAMETRGHEGLKAQPLAQALSVTRGSFYWHFRDLDAFHRAVLSAWRTVALDAVIERIEGLPVARLRALLREALANAPRLETAIRAWAQVYPPAEQMVREVDARRIGYVAALLAAQDMPPDVAQRRGTLLYSAYLGYAWRREALRGPDLESVIDDLIRAAGLSD